MSCPGEGRLPREVTVAPAPTARALRYGRGRCTGCTETIALTKNGLVRAHGPQEGVRPQHLSAG